MPATDAFQEFHRPSMPGSHFYNNHSQHSEERGTQQSNMLPSMAAMFQEGQQSAREQFHYLSRPYSPHDSKRSRPKYAVPSSQFAPVINGYDRSPPYPTYPTYPRTPPPSHDDSLRHTKKPAQRRRELLEDHIRNSAASKLLDHDIPESMVLDSDHEKHDYLSPPSTSPTPSSVHSGRNMPISDILSSDSNGVQTEELVYKLTVRQQPLAARACGFGERDRRVIDPPPILQLTIDSSNLTPAQVISRLSPSYSVVHCSLWDPVRNVEDNTMPESTDKRQQRRLMGTLVASAFVGKDENDVEGCFFCFPDLSVRTPGTYSLKFSFIQIDPDKMSRGNSAPVRATVITEPFHVYNAKDFLGMRASTELTKRLKNQGCLISVKKGYSKANEAHAREQGRMREDDGDNDD
ncbi:hypothetical protein B7463_g8289, partial [Scytalidium lignicola]